MSLDSLQKPTTISETLLEYLERKSSEECDVPDVPQTPLDELLCELHGETNHANQ